MYVVVCVLLLFFGCVCVIFPCYFPPPPVFLVFLLVLVLLTLFCMSCVMCVCFCLCSRRDASCSVYYFSTVACCLRDLLVLRLHQRLIGVGARHTKAHMTGKQQCGFNCDRTVETK